MNGFFTWIREVAVFSYLLGARTETKLFTTFFTRLPKLKGGTVSIDVTLEMSSFNWVSNARQKQSESKY